MPLFCWTSLCTAILMIFATPPLTVATALLALIVYLDFHFFTNDLGGNMMNYVNLFWLFGHPEVYILILPAFGVFSEVISAFSSKNSTATSRSPPPRWRSRVVVHGLAAPLLHHGPERERERRLRDRDDDDLDPTGVKIYNWIWTMFRGEVRFTAPMLFALAFIVTFVLGGLTGIMLAIPPIDYVVHNTVFLVATSTTC